MMSLTNFINIGILGGGQLGLMLTEAAHRLGIRINVLDPSTDCPCANFVDKHIVGDFKDSKSIRELSANCDIITVEIEHVNTEILAELEKEGFKVQPSSSTIKMIQDKLLQKQHLSQNCIAIAEYLDTPTIDHVYEAINRFGLPLMLKSRLFAYDGRGNIKIESKDQVQTAFHKLNNGKMLYAEKWVAYEREIAIIVARSIQGEVVAYPVVDTIHKDSICNTVIVPAQIPSSVALNVSQLAKKAINSFTGAGVFGVELFITHQNEILINEIAPRPHNSGHYTIECCATSQFEQHLRAILGLPLGDTSLIVNMAVMINVLGTGENELEKTMAPINVALSIPGACIHWYNKKKGQTTT